MRMRALLPVRGCVPCIQPLPLRVSMRIRFALAFRRPPRASQSFQNTVDKSQKSSVSQSRDACLASGRLALCIAMDHELRNNYHNFSSRYSVEAKKSALNAAKTFKK